MREFVKTWHCICGLHCNSCRNDAAWRAGKAEKYIMPDKCPHGDRAKWIVPDNACDFCEACEKPPSCPNVTSCCGGKTSVNFVAPCPRGLWRMDKE